MATASSNDRWWQPGGPTLIVVCTTYPDRATAADRAGLLVAARLAACGQGVGPIASCYSWEGAIERSEEWSCHCKTSRGSLAACVDAIRSSHPYTVPEITWTEIQGSRDYVAWVEESTGAAAGGDVAS